MTIPTAEQIAIRDEESLGLLIESPAGCGKTEVLAMRVQGVLARRVVMTPRRVLVLTFSNRARDNIRKRLIEHVGLGALRSRVTVSNLHGFASRLIRAHGELIGLDQATELPSSDWVSDECRRRHLTFSQADATKHVLQRVKHQALTDAEVRAAVVASGNAAALAIEDDRVAAQILTYDDLLRSAELILVHDAVRELYAQHFGCLVVDEFQDLTPQQLRVINRIGFGRTTYAGDVAQGIFGFAGADPESALSAINAEVAVSLPLTASYRSSPAVIQAVNSLIPQTRGSWLTCADPESWPGGGIAAVASFVSTASEAAWCVDFARMVLERAPNHRVAVIARTAPRRRHVDAAFDESGVERRRWDDPLLDTEARSLVEIALAKIKLEEFHGASDRSAYLLDAASVSMISEPETRRAVRDAMGWVADELSAGSSLPEITARIGKATTGSALDSPGAHLLSGHVGKGQQFDWVLVVGAEEGCIPFFRADDDDAVREEARVLSVMISRARHGVVVTSSAVVEAMDGRRFERERSRFVDQMDADGALATHEAANEWLEQVDWQAMAQR